VNISISSRKKAVAYLFLAPSLIVFGVFVFYPIGFALWASFTDWSLINQSPNFLQWANYSRLLADSRFWNAVKNTLYYTLGVVPVGTVISLCVAIAVNQRIRGIEIFRTIYFLPVITSTAIIAIVWTFLFDPDIGLLAYYLKFLGFTTQGWLRDPNYAMPAVILVSIWKNMGFNMVIFLAGLQSISESLYEAASIDGANSWHSFWYVTLPQLRPTLTFVIVMSMISSFQVFDQVYVMTRGGPLFRTETVVQYIYHHGFETFQMSYASTVAIALLLVVLILTILQLRVLDRDIN
jgi:multiple sugar transport system permease protein